MKRTCELAFVLVCAIAALGCGGESEQGSGMMLPPQGQGTGGMSGLEGAGATGSTWAPVIFPSGGTSSPPPPPPPPPEAGAGAAGMVAAGAGGMGAAGMGAAGAGEAGMGAAGMGAAGMGGGMSMIGSKSPTLPAITTTCPAFRSGTISFMGLGGIIIDAGTKPAGPTAPMVFYWHGTGSTAGEYRSMAAAVAAGVRAEGGVLISFQGTTGGDLLSGTSIFGRGDLDLVDQLAACAVRDHNVDPRRIYATGCSAGGLFSTAMAALRSSYVAAAAPNSGGFTGIPVAFETSYTPALMTVHGAAGRDVVFIDFSNSSRNADMAFKNRGGFVINCDHGGGHCGGGPLAGSIWEFFKAHPYGVEPNPWTGGLPAGFHSSCKIF